MFKKLTSFLLILSIITLTFCSCSGDDPINVIFPIKADPECLDPQIAETDAAKLITGNCMEGLVRLSEDGKILPGSAEKWTVSDDGLVYTFTLRDGLAWQMLRSHKDVLGEDYENTFDPAIKAEDFVFGIKRALRPETKAQQAYLLYCIKNAQKVNLGEADEGTLGVEAPDDKTVVIRLSRSNPDFLRILTLPMCMPCDEAFFKATGAKYGLELKYTLCNGPFYVGKWIEDGSLTLYRCEGYKGFSLPTAQAVYLYVNADEDKYISKFNAGDYNAALVSPENLSKLKSSEETTVLSTDNAVLSFLFNCNDSVLSNINLRRALFCASDVSVMKNSESDSFAGGIVPNSCMWGESSYRQSVGNINMTAYDEQKAAQYFKKALSELDTTNVTVNIICLEQYRIPIIKVIQKWEKIFGLSLTVSVKSVEADELEKRINESDYQLAFSSLSAKDGSAAAFLNMFCSEAEGNTVNYQNPAYDNLMKKCAETLGGDSIAAGYKSAEQLLCNDAVIYPVFVGSSYAAVNDTVGGIYGAPGFSGLSFALWGE